MNNKVILVFLVFFIQSSLHSQKISGEVKNVFGEPIPFAVVLIKEAENKDNISEYVISKNDGTYSIELKKEYTKILLEAKAKGYLSEIFVIQTSQKAQELIQDFILVKDTINLLKEVVIKNTKKPFLIAEDTLKFNVSAYKDGSERKIEDIIKKLPGIEVNENTGEIKFRGKSIETVTLEGENLFDSNYSIGTKNINVDMVEQVQAIENYSENALLKGIEKEGKVSLNLKLKKGKIDFSGSIDSGIGLFENKKIAQNNAASVLQVSTILKSFGTVSYNNIGKNKSPFDYFSFNHNIEQIKNKENFVNKTIPESIYTSFLEKTKVNNNSELFANYNNVFKINKRVSVKSNFYFAKDRIILNQSNYNYNIINNQAITTSDSFFTKKNPIQFRGDLALKINTSKNSLLEYKFKISQENITTQTDVIQNTNTNFFSKLDSDNFYLLQNVIFTKKTSQNKAFQILMDYSINSVPQRFVINPSVINPENYSSDNQITENKKEKFSFKSVWLGNKNKSKYSYTIGYIYSKNPFFSDLKNQVNNFESQISVFENNINYRKSSVYFLGTNNFNVKRWRFSPSYSVSFINQDHEDKYDNLSLKNNKIIFEPDLNIRYRINEISNIFGTVSYNQNTISEENLYSNSILVSNRYIKRNIPTLAFQKTISSGINYSINNLYKLFQINFGVNYLKNKGDFFSKININQNITQIENIFLDNNYNNLNLNFLIEKYIPFFESTIKFSSNYAFSDYFNIINNSDLRLNKNKSFNIELLFRTVFDMKVNFENSFKYYDNSSKNDNQEFGISSINNTFKTIIKPNKKLVIIITSDYYLPNINNKKEDYLFLDAILRYKPKSKKYDFSIALNNLLDNNNFIQTNSNDYSTTVYNTNLIPRYFMVNFTYNY